MDAHLEVPIREVGEASASLLEALTSPPGARGAAAAHADAVQSLAAAASSAAARFDAAVTAARLAMYYASGEVGEEAQAEAEAALAIHGAPLGRYLGLFSVSAFASSVAAAARADAGDDAARAAAAAGRRGWRLRLRGGAPRSRPIPRTVPMAAAADGAPPPPAKPPPAPPAREPLRVRVSRAAARLGLPPEPARWVYALKLTAAVCFATALASRLFGTGLWAALSVSFIGPRDGSTKHAGGSFRTAGLRLTGTVIGAMYGFFVASAWVFSCSFLRITSARTVLMFSPPPPVVTVGPNRTFDSQSPATILLLAGWVFVVGLARASPRHTYGALVAQFTPYVMADEPRVGGNAVAKVRERPCDSFGDFKDRAF